MKLISAKYHNFMGFGETDNVIDFEKLFADGDTVLVIGVRDGDPKHSNGTGKSTLVEGICYGFFGRLPRIVAQHPEQKGEVAREIVRTDMNDEMIVGDCYVELKFESGDGRIWRLKRGRRVSKNRQNHSRILELESEGKDGERHTGANAEKMIPEILKFSFEALINSCLFAQRDSGKFLSGADSVKKDLFMELVGTQIVDRMLANVRRRKSLLNQERAQIDAKIGVLKDRVTATSHGNPKDKQAGLENRLRKCDEDIAVLEKKLAESSDGVLQEKHTRLSDDLAQLQTGVAKLESERDAKIAPLQSKYDEAQAHISRCDAETGRIEQQKQRLQTEYNELEAKVVTDEKLAEMERVVNQAKENVREREQRLKELTEQRNRIASETVKLETQIGAAAKARDSIEKFLKTGEPGSPCPTCGSQWTKEGAESEISRQNSVISRLVPEDDELKKQIKSLDGIISDVEINLREARMEAGREADFVRIRSASDAARARCEQIMNEASGVKDREAQIDLERHGAHESRVTLVEQIEEARQSYENKLAEKRSEVGTKDKERKDIRAEISALQEQIEGFRKVLEGIRGDKSQVERDLAALNARIEESQKDHDELCKATDEMTDVDGRLNRVLVLEDVMSKDGFKTQVAKRYVPHMNRYANEFLSLLSPDLGLDISMDDNAIKIAVEGASASNYDMCSGGEQEAIRLAVNIANSMISISGDADLPGIILLDEIFGSLDPMVRKNVFMLLERLSDYFPCIVVITHDPSLQSGFSLRLVVAKEGKVARIDGLQKAS